MSPTTNFDLRQSRAGDRNKVAALLADIDRRYPGGLAWFDRRYDDILLGRAQGVIACKGSEILGTVIVTPKGANSAKLSTIKVHPTYRRNGVASDLISHLKTAWQSQGIEEVRVTVDSSDNATKCWLIEKAKFEELTVCPDRYGIGRHETILVWKPEMEETKAYRDLVDFEAACVH